MWMFINKRKHLLKGWWTLHCWLPMLISWDTYLMLAQYTHTTMWHWASFSLALHCKLVNSFILTVVYISLIYKSGLKSKLLCARLVVRLAARERSVWHCVAVSSARLAVVLWRSFHHSLLSRLAIMMATAISSLTDC